LLRSEIVEAMRGLHKIGKMAEKEAWADVIPHVIWHDLWRTRGCRLLQDHEMELKRVSEWLGHASVGQTERAYAFLDVSHLHRAVAQSPVVIQGRHKTVVEGSRSPFLGRPKHGTTRIIDQRSAVETDAATD
jgi:hypothetical protein